MALALGDSHNFGRRVAIEGSFVRKPRALLWEWLVLSRESPLRRALARVADEDGLGDTFAFLPSLAFKSVGTRDGGAVERIALRPLRVRSAAQKAELAAIAGRMIALFSWLGVSDLHWENLVLGADADGRTVFGPLDVEMILADLSLPTATKLLPDADPEYAEICRHACGMRRVLPYLGKPIAAPLLLAMAGAYAHALALLERHARTIAQVIADVPRLRETPIRICLRSTGDYVRARSEPIWPPLLDAESEQLARGDIPYFFRLYGRPGIHWFGDARLTKQKTLSTRGDVPRLDPILGLSRGLRSPSRKKLREEGLFTVLGAFDHDALRGRYENDEIAVTFKPRTIDVRFADGSELSAHRDLSAFVGSAYLPCRCGEVRSVLVPARTRCERGIKRA